MNKICTTLEQSQKLIELGIDVNTADMCYRPTKDMYRNIIGYSKYPDVMTPRDRSFFNELGYEPCWSLTALIDLLPDIIPGRNCWGGYHLYITKIGICYAFYGNDVPDTLHSVELYNEYTEKNEGVESLVDAAYEMICWLKENNKL